MTAADRGQIEPELGAFHPAMSRDLKTFFVRIAALGAAACSSVYAVHSAPRQPIQEVPAAPAAPSPYQVELIDSAGRPLDTYGHRGRFYVLGHAGDRYSIRVNNPTSRRVEAVISVDGLDVIDGETADFARKRGYVVPAHGTLTVDGFRMSTTQVAAFRFSSVSNSYADRKGKGRNVGVIGVAIFEEQAEPQMILPEPRRLEPHGGTWDRRGGGDFRDTPQSSAPASDAAGAPPPPRAKSGTASGAGAGGAPAPARRMESAESRSDMCCRPPERQRPGLGTAWGEERYSAIDFTRFVRAHATVPSATAELRYNDTDGLRALGIALAPSPSEHELWTRETADPFPGSRFATPPR